MIYQANPSLKKKKKTNKTQGGEKSITIILINTLLCWREGIG